MRKILIFTGKRGGFGAMLKLMERIDKDPDMVLQLVVSDMHLQTKFGETITEIETHYPVNAVVDLGEYDDSLLSRTKALGYCVNKLSDVLADLSPDILVLLGDRGETLAAAFCAVEMNIPIAHIQAGDISGGIDDIHRHAITKLAHYHFSQNEAQRQRVIKLGESPDRVFNTGAPYVDNLLDKNLLPPDSIKEKYGIPLDEQYFIVLHHPDTYEPEKSYVEMKSILNALRDGNEYKIVIYPCSDPGYAGILSAIQEIQGAQRFIVRENIEALSFLTLLRDSKAIIGNSSGGIIEAPYFNIPFLLVGNRQDGRDMAKNVIQIGSSEIEITQALVSIDDPIFQEKMKLDSYPFGDGSACEKIFTVLKNRALGENIFRKRITY